MITGNEPIIPMTYRQTGDNTSIVATPKDLNDSQHQHYLIFHEGLTIRQHFAAMAMASDDYESPTSQYDHRAKIWLAKADALIAELNKPQPK